MLNKELIRRTHKEFLNSAKKDRTEKIKQLKSNINYYYNNPMISNTYKENNKESAYNGKIYLRWLNIYCKSLE